MSNDELNISAAVQRYEVSRKTVRRRLAEGAIEGARQEPGDHGPEWVFPAGSLEALGYSRRSGSGSAATSEDASSDDLGVAGNGSSSVGELPFAIATAPQPRGSRRELVVVLAVILGLLLGFLGTTLFRSDDPSSGPVASLLEELTRPGDEIGVVGAPADAQLPTGRVPVPVDDLDEVPRYVVIGEDGDPEVLEALLATAKPVLALDRAAGELWLFDTGGEPLPASSTSEVTSTTEPTATSTSAAPVGPSITGAPTTTTPTVTAPTTTITTPTGAAPDPGPSVKPEPSEGDPNDPRTDPSAAPPTTVTVVEGDSFWTIAETITADSLGTAPTDAQITAYWGALVDANLDSLVQPGNPDLIFPGQVFELPAP